MTAAIGGAAAGWWLTGGSLPSALASTQTPTVQPGTATPAPSATTTPSGRGHVPSGTAARAGTGGSVRHTTSSAGRTSVATASPSTSPHGSDGTGTGTSGTGPSSPPPSPPAAPVVTVAAPLDGSTAHQLTTLALQATATQGGSPLPTGDVSWTLTREGDPTVIFTASGATASVPASTMTPGVYHVTATATDAQGSASASATVTVPLPVTLPSVPSLPTIPGL